MQRRLEFDLASVLLALIETFNKSLHQEIIAFDLGSIFADKQALLKTKLSNDQFILINLLYAFVAALKNKDRATTKERLLEIIVNSQQKTFDHKARHCIDYLITAGLVSFKENFDYFKISSIDGKVFHMTLLKPPCTTNTNDNIQQQLHHTIIVTYLSQSPLINEIGFDQFPFNYIANFYERIAANSTIHTLSFARMDLNTNDAHKMLDIAKKNTSIKHLYFDTAEVSAETLQRLTSMVDEKPELEQVVVRNNDTLIPFKQILDRRNFILYSTKCNNRELQLKLCHLFVRLYACQTSFDVAEVSAVKQTLLALARSYDDSSAECQIIRQFVCYAESITPNDLPNDPETVTTYQQLFRDYHRLLNIFSERNILVFSINGSPYPNQAHCEPNTEQHTSDFYRQHTKEIIEISVRLARSKDKILTGKKSGLTSKLLHMSIASLLLQYEAGSPNLNKPSYDNRAALFGQDYAALYGKEIAIRDSAFTYAIFTGLCLYFHCYFYQVRLSPDNENKLFSIFDKLIQTLTVSTHQSVTLHALTALCCACNAGQLEEGGVVRVSKFKELLLKAIEDKKLNKLPTRYSELPIDSADEYLSRVTLWLSMCNIKAYMYLKNILAATHQKNEKHQPGRPQPTPPEFARLFMRSPVNSGNIVALASDLLEATSDFHLRDHLLFPNDSILIMDHLRVSIRDPAGSFSFVAARNASLMIGYRMLFQEPLSFIKVALRYVDVGSVLQEKHVAEDHYKLVASLAITQSKLLEKLVEHSDLVIFIKQLIDNKTLVYPTATAVEIHDTNMEILEQSRKTLQSEYEASKLRVMGIHSQLVTRKNRSDEEYDRFMKKLPRAAPKKSKTPSIKQNAKPQKKEKQQTPAHIQRYHPPAATTTTDPQEEFDKLITNALSINDFSEAQTIAERALQQLKRITPYDHAACLARLGFIFTMAAEHEKDVSNIRKHIEHAKKSYLDAIDLCCFNEDDNEELSSFADLLRQECERVGIVERSQAKKSLREADALFSTYRFNDALRQYQQIKPIDEVVVFKIVDCYEKMGFIEEAIRALTDFAQPGSMTPDMKLRLAALYTNSNRRTQAATLFAELEELPSKPIGWHKSLFRYLYRTQALSRLNIELNALADHTHNHIGRLFDLAIYFHKLGMLEKAEEYFIHLEAISGNTTLTLHAAYYATLLADQHHYVEAHKKLDEILITHPHHLFVITEKATIYAKEGKITKALELVEPLIDQYPDYLSVKMTKLYILRLSNRHHELNVFLEQLIKSHPHHRDSNYFYFKLHTKPSPDLIQSIKQQFPDFTESRSPKVAQMTAMSVTPIVRNRARVLPTNELPNQVTLPADLCQLLADLEKVGEAYLFGRSSRHYLLSAGSSTAATSPDKISICLFTKCDHLRHDLASSMQIYRVVGANQLFSGLMNNNVRVYIVLRPLKQSLKEFVSQLDTQASGLLLDRHGVLRDPFNARENVLLRRISPALPGININPLMIMHHIRHLREGGFSGGDNGQQVLCQDMTGISNIEPHALLIELRKTVSRRVFTAILSDWYTQGITQHVLPEFSVLPKELLLGIASYCDQLEEDRSPRNLLVTFLSLLLWYRSQHSDCYAKTYQQIMSEMPLIAACTQSEYEQIQLQLSFFIASTMRAQQNVSLQRPYPPPAIALSTPPTMQETPLGHVNTLYRQVD